MRKLEIGGGRNAVAGYETLDYNNSATYTSVWGEDGLPFDDNTFGEVYSAHTIEHVPWYNIDYALAEAYRVLKHGGVIEIHTPDLDYLIDCYKKGITGDGWNARGRNKQMDPFVWFNSRLFNLPDGTQGLCSPNWHRSTFNFAFLKKSLEKAGFKNVVRLKGLPKGKMPRSIINMGIKAVK